jgi:hypothetical protein
VNAAGEALEALGHPVGALPEPRLLAALFVRFQAQVPLRAATEERGGEASLAAWLEDGAGCSGESRVEAFGRLAAAAGFDVERALARDGAGTERTVLLADRRRVLLDVSFPLPAPLFVDPPAEGEATGYGMLSVRPGGPGRYEVRLETRGEERSLFRVETGSVDPGTSRPGSGAPLAAASDPGVGAPAFRGPGLFRLLDDRLLRWQDGVLEVSDAWSRLRVPFSAEDVDGLEALFGPPAPELDPAEPAELPGFAPTIAVYLASAEDPARLGRLLAEPGTHAALLPEGWVVEGPVYREDRFERTLLEDGTLLRRERITVLPDGAVVEAEGPLALFRTRTWRLEPRPAGTRLRIVATLRDPVPPRGLPEGTRRRLVFELASELLALDRLAGER